MNQTSSFNSVNSNPAQALHPMQPNLPLAYCLLDPNGRIQFMTPYGLRALGYSYEELLGRSFIDLSASPADKDQTRETLIWKTTPDRDYVEYDMSLARKDGQLIWIRLTLQPVYDANRCIESFHAYFLDITEIKNSEHKLQKLTDHFEHHMTERMRSFVDVIANMERQIRRYSQFHSDILHEIRTPLTNMTLRLYLYERGNPNDREKHLSVLKQQVSYVTNLVENIAELARVSQENSKAQFRAVNLHSIIEDVVLALRPRAEEKDLQLNMRLAAENAYVYGNATQLAQVFSNLIANALNYTQAGQVTIHSEVDQATNQLKVSVQDTGMGIPEEDLPHIFERFSRGRNVLEADIPGTGLGLGIVREIVKSHNGSIQAHSQEGTGTTFTLTLPWYGPPH